MARQYVVNPDVNDLRRMLPGLIAYAAKWLRVTGVPGDPEDLVQRGIAALFAGRCPVEVPVRAFLKQCIKHGATNGARSPSSRWEEIPERAEADGASPEEGAAWGLLLDDVAAALQAKAEEADDTEVFMLLHAYLDGHEKRADVADAAGLSIPQFDAARKRMSTMIGALPAEWRAQLAKRGVAK